MLLLTYRSRCSLRNILYMWEKKIRVVSPRVWRNDSSISQREVAPSSFSWAKRTYGCVAFRNCRAIDQLCFVITLVWGIVDVLPPVWYSYVSLRTYSVCIDTRLTCDSVIPVISLCRSRSNRYLLCHRGEASERERLLPLFCSHPPPFCRPRVWFCNARMTQALLHRCRIGMSLTELKGSLRLVIKLFNFVDIYKCRFFNK